MIKDYLNDVDIVYSYLDGNYTPLTDISTLGYNELIINDNSIDSNFIMNRNISVLERVLRNKVDKGKTFSNTDIQCDAPQGYILVTDGPGQSPYWVDPLLFKDSIMKSEVVSSTKLSYNYSTIQSSQFSTITGASITDKITFTSDSSSVILNAVTIPNTVEYGMKMRITPINRNVLSYGQNHMIISGTGFDSTYSFYVITGVGLIEIKPTMIEVVGTNTKITTDTVFTSAYKAYMFKLDVSCDIYVDSVGYKKQYIEDVTMVDNDLYLSYVRKECSGTKIKFKLVGNSSLVVQYIDIDLKTGV